MLPEYQKCHEMFLDFIKVSSYVISKIQKTFAKQSISYQFSGFEFLAQMVPLKVLQRHRNGLKRDVSLHFLNFINHDFWISYP